jgi:uncharacterized membrane protein YqiK
MICIDVSNLLYVIAGIVAVCVLYFMGWLFYQAFRIRRS